MKKIIDYLLSCIYLLYFGLILVIFHGIQWLCFNLGGHKWHQRSVHWLNFFIVHGWILTGSVPHFQMLQPLEKGKSYLFIANHQSMFDIPGIIWFWRAYVPLFVAKKELSKGIPSISYNLRVGKAALIDRKDGKAAIVEIARLGKYVCENKFSAAIFPEGTRSRTGQLKEFQAGGISAILKKCPDILVVPICIQNTARFNPQGVFPLRSFTKLSWSSLHIIDPKGMNAQEVADAAKGQIQAHLDKFNQ